MSRSVAKVTRRPNSFAPHRDWWVLLGGLLLITLFLAVVPYIFASSLPLWQRGVMAGIALLCTVNIVDKLFFTFYELDSEGLLIHSQLRFLKIPYRTMDSVDHGGLRTLISTQKRKRFAFSRQNIVIHLHDQMWEEISLSPHDEPKFLSQLLATIDTERSRRATVTRSRRT